MPKIIAPNKDYSGVSASVTFTKGVGETSNPVLIEWFRENGYEVEDEITKEIDDMTVPELKAHAELHSIDLGEAKLKDEILAKIKGV